MAILLCAIRCLLLWRIWIPTIRIHRWMWLSWIGIWWRYSCWSGWWRWRSNKRRRWCHIKRCRSRWHCYRISRHRGWRRWRRHMRIRSRVRSTKMWRKIRRRIRSSTNIRCTAVMWSKMNSSTIRWHIVQCIQIRRIAIGIRMAMQRAWSCWWMRKTRKFISCSSWW